VLASSPGMSTLADAAQSLASYSASRAGMPPSQQDLTPASHASWPPTTRGSIGAVRKKKSGGVLKPLSIGLGVLAAAAAIAVGGMVIHAKLIAPDQAAPAAPQADAAAPVAVPVAPAIAPEAPAVVVEGEEPVEVEAPVAEDENAPADPGVEEGEPAKRRTTSTRPKGTKAKASTTKPKSDKPKTDKPKPKSGKADIDAFWPGG
jgi:hypothetical protein